MSKKSSLLAVERAQTVGLHMQRLSERPMAKRLQCSKSPVHCHIERFKKHKIYDDVRKTGRHFKTSRRNNHAIDEIQRAVMRCPTGSCCKIRANLQNNGTDISINTVSCYLSKYLGIKFYKQLQNHVSHLLLSFSNK